MGWAVSVKTDADSDNGKGWFWVEYISAEQPYKVMGEPGKGQALCVGCHATGGHDYVLSHIPD